MADDEFTHEDLQRCALAYVLEDEIWPSFIEYMWGAHVSPASHKWLETANLANERKTWLQHSKDNVFRALGHLIDESELIDDDAV